jgi:sulfatase modifying factor 1
VGTDRPLIRADGESPRRRVRLAPFAIELYAVNNARFAAFAGSTGYVTEAERLGNSFVFFSHVRPELARVSKKAPEAPWWLLVEGASWRTPEGPGSGTEGRELHPVVHVSWNDATAFAAWVGGRLPSEAEWEYAARGGSDCVFPWGDTEPSDEDPPCNIWQGQFPENDLGADGFRGTAPVNAFSPNGYGLFNVVGNVWEWCADPFRVRLLSAVGRHRNREAGRAGERLMKGGSFLCHRSYCYRYRIAARMGRPPSSSASHVGFRVAYSLSHELLYKT